MTRALDRIGSALVVIAGGVALVSLVRNRPVEGSAPSPDEQQVEVTAVSPPDWESAMAIARFDGEPAGAVTLIEFVDVECPYCARYAETVRAVTMEFGQRVAVGYVHLPLSQHRFARSGAVALECAHDQLRFHALLDELLASQDSIGLISWERFAARAGVADVPKFGTCLLEGESSKGAIAAGVDLGRRIGIRGTPGVLIDGRNFTRPPSLNQLRGIVQARLRGKSVDEAIAETR